jgi:hypothetical protein
VLNNSYRNFDDPLSTAMLAQQSQVIMRIQQTFAKVRVDMFMARAKSAYDWFKIRNTNGVGAY